MQLAAVKLGMAALGWGMCSLVVRCPFTHCGLQLGVGDTGVLPGLRDEQHKSANGMSTQMLYQVLRAPASSAYMPRCHAASLPHKGTWGSRP